MTERAASRRGSALTKGERYGLEAAGAGGLATLMAGKVGFALIAVPPAAALPAGAMGAAGAGKGTAGAPLAAATATSAVVHTTRPNRDALWKLPCPRMGDQATPELFFMA